MQLLFKKAAALMTVTMFLIPSVCSAATLEGQVLSLKPKGPGIWKVVVQGAQGKRSLIISAETTLKKEVPVETLKAGDRLVSKSGGGQGVLGVKDPLKGMADATKKALGLPNIPNIPQIPKIPQMPDKNQMIKGPGGAGPSPAQAGGGGLPGGAAGPGGGAPEAGGPAPQKKTAEEPKVKTQDEMLQEKGFQNEKLLFPPKEGVNKPGEEITQINKTDRGFEVTVVSSTGKPAKQTYALGQKVLKVLTLKEIKKSDKVLLNFNETDKSVIELQVKG